MYKILFVDDDKKARDNIEQILKKLFDEVEVASDGIEGLEKYKLKEFDIVVSDIQMPEMDGLEFLKKIKQINPLQKVIVFSAYNDHDHYMKAFNEIGVDGYLEKPFNLKQFLSVLNKVLKEIDLTYNLEYKLKKISSQLEEIQKKDYITDSFNLFKLKEELKSEWEIVLLDIKHFSNINMAYSFEVGNKILKNVVKHLEYFSKNVYRINSDKFAILVKKDSIFLAKKIRDYFNDVVISADDLLFKFNYYVIASRGNCLEEALLALEMAKSKGLEFYVFNKKDFILKSDKLNIINIHNIFIDAIKNDKIVPYYQGIYNNKTGKINKFETLVRIVDNDKIYTPFEFLDIAKKSGFYIEITKILIDKTFKLMQENNFEFSFNITAIDLEKRFLVKFLNEKIQEYKIDPSRVIIEIVETVDIVMNKKFTNQLKKLKKIGFKIAMDDFGTKYSNFENIIELDVDFLKIDGKFIKDILNVYDNFVIASTLVDFAKKKDIKVIAEFVSSKEIFEVVKRLDIDYSQGYYFSVPSPKI